MSTCSGPPYHLVGSSLGAQVVLTYAVRSPEKVSKLVLICPSGFHGDETLPMIEGVRRSNYESLVKSVFYGDHFVSDELVAALARKFQDRKWKKGVLKTLRATVGHSVSALLEQVSHPTLVIWGANDRVLSDVPGAIRAAERIPEVRQVVIPRCGHAPQIEKSRLVNHLVSRFLRDRLKTIPPALDPSRFLAQRAEPGKAKAGFLASPLQFNIQPMNDFGLFLGKFLTQGTSIASIAPSSRWLRRRRSAILTGTRTEPGRARSGNRPDHAGDCPARPTRLPGRRGRTRSRLCTPAPRTISRAAELRVVHGDVSDLAAILADRGIEHVDHVISGLPVPSFPRALQDALFVAVARFLRPDGTFNQITELPWVYWRFYRRYFHDVQFAFEPRNLPPAGAYFCRDIKT